MRIGKKRMNELFNYALGRGEGCPGPSRAELLVLLRACTRRVLAEAVGWTPVGLVAFAMGGLTLRRRNIGEHHVRVKVYKA